MLGVPVDVVNMSTAVARLAELVDRGPEQGGAMVVTLNPEILMRARREPDLAGWIGGAALIIPDGIGLVRVLRRRGLAAERVTGVDLVEAYAPLAAARRHRLALCGAAPGVAAGAAATLTARFEGLQVVASDSGDPVAATAERLRTARPDVVLAAYGARLQERFLAEHLAATGAAVGIGVGGTLDFLSGRIRRAPAPLRRAGLEWAWRLLRQPWRWQRQSVLPVFWWLARRESVPGDRLPSP